MLYMCIEYHIYINMYHVSAQGVDENMINVHYYYYISGLQVECAIKRKRFRVIIYNLQYYYYTTLHYTLSCITATVESCGDIYW